MPTTTTPRSCPTCTHTFPDGHRCGSPALHGEPFCYYHHDKRKPIRNLAARNRRRAFSLSTPRNRDELQTSLNEVILRLAANQIDHRRAGLILFALQIAANNLP
jgi:hypothetical protein